MFIIHYGFEPTQLYVSPDLERQLRMEYDYMFRFGSAAHFLGMEIFINDGPMMLMTRRDNATFRWMNGEFTHAVLTPDERVAIWREVPQ